MFTVALETSTDLGSVALGGEEGLLAECSLSVRIERSETLLPVLEGLLERSGRRPEELEAVVVGAGPGSFTGVRIGASLAKGLVGALDVPLFAYSSLAALAAGTGVPARVCALLPARGDVVYAGAFRTVEPLDPLGPSTAASVPELLESLEDPGGWTFAGRGALDHREALEARGGRVLSRLHSAPRAASLLALCASQPEAGRVEEPGSWEPRYVRASGAERGV